LFFYRDFKTQIFRGPPCIRFPLSASYLSPNYPFTLRVTGIKTILSRLLHQFKDNTMYSMFVVVQINTYGWFKWILYFTLAVSIFL